ncbi:NepR family anti-sigma factor [Sphingomonas sp. CJ99]
MPAAKGRRPVDGKPAKSGERNVGDALRAVYHEAVDENIPKEMLDLLNKLS